MKKRKNFAAINAIIVFLALFIIAEFSFIPLTVNAENKSRTISVKVTGSAECKNNVIIELNGSQHALKDTNKRGRVKFKNVPEGTYILSPQKNNIVFSKESKKVNLKGRKKIKYVKFKASRLEDMPTIISFPGEGQMNDEICTKTINVYTSTVYPVLHYPGDYMHK